MLSKVRDFIARHNLINKGELIVVAVSGGPDSVALLHILHRLKDEMGFSMHVAHLNHCLREEADREEAFVGRMAGRLGVPCTAARADVGKMAHSQGMSLEEAGREARYAFFRRLQQELGAAKVATAHHQGDQAETILMRLVRGSGLKGLRGIVPYRDVFIRPLLSCTREEILGYLKDHELEYCVDPSNYSERFLRNRIRHQLLPLLEREYNPNIVANLARLAAIIRDENQVVEELAAAAWEACAVTHPDGDISLAVREFKELPAAIQRRVILLALTELGGSRDWEMKDVELVLEMAQKEGSSKEIQLSRGVRVGKSYGELILSTQVKKPRPFRYFLQIPGKTYVREMQAGIECSFLAGPPETAGRGLAYLDWDKLKKPLEVRSRRPGDRFRPLGLGGTKKLQDFFVDIKLPARERERVGILACGGDIYWVIGYRLDERAVADDRTRRVLVVKVEPGTSN